MSMSSELPDPRVNDTDRSVVLDRLADAMRSGALTPTEFEDRTQLAAAAVTAADLRPLTHDLPASGPDRSVEKAADVRSWLTEWQWWLGGAVLLSGIWAVQCAARGEVLRYWPLLPLGIWAVVLVAVAVWPRPDHD